MHGQLATTAQRKTTDRGNDRLANRGYPFPAGEIIPLAHVNDRGVGHFADVGTGGKRPLATREHDDVDVGIAIETLQHVDQRIHQLHGQRIQHFRPVQRRNADVAFRSC